jgi:hypothetical protein
LVAAGQSVGLEAEVSRDTRELRKDKFASAFLSICDASPPSLLSEAASRREYPLRTLIAAAGLGPDGLCEIILAETLEARVMVACGD